MPKLTIDGREIECAPGTTVIRAARDAGVEIPHYCWHPGLTVAGNCRMCLVEVEKMPKLAIACSTQAADGMIVSTANPRVTGARDAIMEFLLINHPLDCPICDQAGECRLQQYSYRYGAGESRFVEEKTHKPKRVDIGPHILLDSERCIVCTRCVRFCQEVSGTHELTVGDRGDRAIIETFPGRSLDNAYSGNTVDICPVGALTLKEFRFRSRVWFLKDVPSVCAGCARGCSITVGAKDESVLRFVPRENPEVNAWWMCDAGRLSWKSLTAAPRIPAPRALGIAARPGWTAALDAAAAKLAAVRTTGGAVAVLATPRATNEDLFAAALLARDGLGGAPVYLPVHEEGADDAILIRKDKSPNGRGAREILTAVCGRTPGTVADLQAAIAAGQVRGLVAMGHTMMGADGAAPLDAAALKRLDAVVVVDGFESPLAAAAHAVLPAQIHTETEGTVTNFKGQTQRVRAAVPPAADARPAWKSLVDLARRLGAAQEVPTGAPALFVALAAAVPAFAGLDHAALGERGRMIQEAAGAP